MADRTPQQSGYRDDQPNRPEPVSQPSGEIRGEEKEYPNNLSGEQRDADGGRGSWQPEEQPNFDDAL